MPVIRHLFASWCNRIITLAELRQEDILRFALSKKMPKNIGLKHRFEIFFTITHANRLK